MVGWGLSTCQEEETCQEEPRIENMEDWVSGVDVPSQNLRQGTVSDWIGKQEPPSSPTGWKTEDKKVRKQRGKLTKAEIEEMKASHIDIGTMFKKRQDANEKEEKEPEKDIPEIEKEHSMFRWKMKKQRWENWKICKQTLLSLVEDMLESVESEVIPTCMTRSGWKSSQGGSAGGVTVSVDDIS